MDNLFLLSLLVSFFALVVAIIKPSTFQKVFKQRANRKFLSLFFIISMIVSFIGLAIFVEPTDTQQNTTTNIEEKTVPIVTDDNPKEKENEQQVLAVAENIINFVVLDQGGDGDGIYKDILISENDANQEKIKSLMRSSTLSDSSNLIVRVYTSKQAWEEMTNNKYTSVVDKGYIAYYSRKTSQGINKITWMQEVGVLDDLYGKTVDI